NLDKVVHFGMFGLMTILLFLTYKIFDIRLIIFPFLISFLIEILQGTLTFLHRSFDFVDLMANLSGITIAYILVTYYLQYKKTQ
ncbi:MAG: VanZ family protein, partial [Algoriella sp.]